MLITVFLSCSNLKNVELIPIPILPQSSNSNKVQPSFELCTSRAEIYEAKTRNSIEFSDVSSFVQSWRHYTICTVKCIDGLINFK